jgi:hypothetical protein
MISIIICSANNENLLRVQSGIAETIGVPYELIVLHNEDGKYGICTAYNIGGARAKFPILCFMHEDVRFETLNWGNKVLQHFQDPQTGLIGVAGGDAKSLIPSHWSSKMISNEVHIIQHYRREPNATRHIRITGDRMSSNKVKVIAVDGVWMCTRKEVFETFMFDEKNFNGFHGYDIDFSLQVGNQFGVYVVFDILLHHFSEGSADINWLKSALKVSKKWRKHLPVSVYKSSEVDYLKHHWQTMQVFLQDMMMLKYPITKLGYYFLYYSFNRFFRPRQFLSMTKYIAATYYKKPSAT